MALNGVYTTYRPAPLAIIHGSGPSHPASNASVDAPSSKRPASITPWMTASARTLSFTLTMMPKAANATAATANSVDVNTEAGFA